MCADRVSVQSLRGLEPIASLSHGRLAELAGHCDLERIGKDRELPARGIAGQSVYLLSGEMSLTFPDGTTSVLLSGSEKARYALGRRGGMFVKARAVTDIELARIDDELLDIVATWDQLATSKGSAGAAESPSAAANVANWALMSGIFSVANLRYGVFSQLPAAHIDELLGRFERIEVSKGDVVIREGAEGDYYYVIESGKSRVERMIGGALMPLAELKSGDAFGEEALVSEAKRNATVTMITRGALLRLDKKDFNVLLRQPLLHRLSMQEAREKAANGAQWIDVRYSSEYQYDKLPGAINIPLAEIRNAVGVLDKDREYLLYCQSERRSAAAAFLLAQRGYRASVLAGGLWQGARSGVDRP